MKKSVISIVLVLFLLMLFACSHKTNSTALDADGDSGTGTTSQNKPSSPSGGGGSGGNASIPKSSPNYQPLPSAQEPSSDLDPSSQEHLDSDSDPLGQDPSDTDSSSETDSSSQDPSDSDSSEQEPADSETSKSKPYVPIYWNTENPDERWCLYDFSTEENDKVFVINLFGRAFEGEDRSDYYELKYAMTDYTGPGSKYTTVHEIEYIEPGLFPIGTWRSRHEGNDEWLIFTENTVLSYSRWFVNAEYSYLISGDKIKITFIRALETDEEAGTKRKLSGF
jgi:hypothetical protein